MSEGTRLGSIVVLTLVLLAGYGAAAPTLPQQDSREQRTERLRDEEVEDYFEKWLTEDVVYIIKAEEKAVFESLNTPEEKEQFIEQFWRRRDPDMTTAINEFKEEHYRRIAYANERFTSGEAGWKTDRGRIYIIHGPPDHIEPHPVGGAYERSIYEGGGSTATFPFEVWRYRHLDGVGDDVELEFVDPSYSGQYKLTSDPDEKDAFAKVPTLGSTWDEQEGLMTRSQRGTNEDTRFWRRRDRPFDRFYQYHNVQQAPTIKYRDLQEIVKVHLTYESFPFRVRIDHFDLSGAQVLVPITIEIDNQNLSFTQENGKQVAKVAIYGVVTSITNQIITEFDDDLVNSFPPGAYERALTQRSVYQKILPLEKKGRYKVDLVVKDLNSGKLSVTRKAIVPPRPGNQKLEISSIILSDYVKILRDIPDQQQMFVLGDVWIRPSISNVFWNVNALGAYFQLYNFNLDQSNLEPDISVEYEISKDHVPVVNMVDDKAPVHFFSQQRVVVLRRLPIEKLEPGKYVLSIKAHDRLKNEVTTTSTSFQVEVPPQQP